MNFCKVCDNMYYMKIKEDETEALIYYCKNCGMEEDNLVLTNLCVSRTEEVNSTQKTNKINEYTIHDPTLPHIYTMKCPNDQCEVYSKDKKQDVIYMRVDDVNMKYLYLCTVCETKWAP